MDKAVPKELMATLLNERLGTRGDVAALRPLDFNPADLGEMAKGAGAGLAGMPVDVLLALMEPFGYDVPREDVVGSSDWIGSQMGVDPQSGPFIAGQFLSPDPMDAMRMSDIVQAMTVFHASPHKWDKVDLSKVGTGEGAQAFGHGFYTAGDPKVGEDYYQTFLNDRRYFFRGEPYEMRFSHGNPIDDFKQDVFDEMFLSDLSAEDALKGAQQKLTNRMSGTQKDLSFYERGHFGDNPDLKEKLLRQIDDFKQQRAFASEASPSDFQLQSSAHMYELDLPDETIDKMLDWNAPLSEQPESVQKAVASYMDSHPAEFPSGTDSYFSGEDPLSGSRFYKMLTQRKGDDMREASVELEKLGIPGIKYWDGFSRAKGEGSRNYVVFSEDAITPLKRDGEPINSITGQ